MIGENIELTGLRIAERKSGLNKRKMHIAHSDLDIIVVLPGLQGIPLESHRSHLSRLVSKEKELSRDIIGQTGLGSIRLWRGRIEIDLYRLAQHRFKRRSDLDRLALRRILRIKRDRQS